LTAGLPGRPIARCGLAVSRRDPRVLVAVIQTDQTQLLRDAEWGQAAKPSDRIDTGGVFRSVDRGETWTKLNDLCPRPFYFSQVRIDPTDDQRVYVLGVNLHVSTDGGKTFRSNGAASAHADHHALWIDPADAHHLVLGGDGGMHFSYDQGATWEHVRNMPIGQFYGIAVDLRRPYRVYGGLQDNGSWGGPSATHNEEGITAADWKRILGADGYECQVDPDDPDTVYAESQWGGLTRVNVRTGETTNIAPRDPDKGPAYRYNWDSPMLLSPHNPHTLYFGGNHLFRSVNRGDSWQEISSDLTRGPPGPSADKGHTITTVAESPVRAGLLYAGTDDGRLWVRRPGDSGWTELSDHIPGLPPERWITRVECSHATEGTAYVTIDRHRNDDTSPYIFRTTDYGAHWQPLAHNLPPEGPVHVLREDPRNPDLLFAGTEFGLFVSLDAGAAWQALRGGLPTVAVSDLVIHPRDRDLVIATHGRSLFVLDVAPLEEWSERVRAAEATLFDVKPAALFPSRSPHALKGNKPFAAPNPPFGAAIWYFLRDKAAQPVRLSVTDALGNTVAVLTADAGAGLHRVQWDLRGTTAGVIGRPAPLVPPGDYVARLEVGSKVLVKRVRVEAEE
jgi:photosystem II stability/assembly factor-like uncharacterized protein